MQEAFTVLGWLVMITLIGAIVRQLSERRDIYFLPDSWGKTFAHHGQAGRGVFEKFENYASASQAAGANAPYSLLAGVLEKKETEGHLTAETCYEKDFLVQSNKVGNYIQRTNNFIHATPDNCSAPLTEFVDSYYVNKA